MYNGRTFTIFSYNDKPFKNVHSIIEDKEGNIWLGGSDGLWRYNGSTFINFTQKFVGHIIEDKKAIFEPVLEALMARIGHFAVII